MAQCIQEANQNSIISLHVKSDMLSKSITIRPVIYKYIKFNFLNLENMFTNILVSVYECWKMITRSGKIKSVVRIKYPKIASHNSYNAIVV